MKPFLTIGAIAFAASALLNIFADFLPIPATRLMNFVGVSLGILGLQALYLFHPNADKATLAAHLIATFGFIGIAGFLFADAFIFPALAVAQVANLTAGPTGLAIFAAVTLYVLGVLALTATLFRQTILPKPALALWAIGTAPTITAIALPPAVMTVAEITASLGILWIATTMLRSPQPNAVAV